MEYLMTYGWAILVVMIVGIVMWQLGIFNPGSATAMNMQGFGAVKPQLAACGLGADGAFQCAFLNAAGTPITITQVKTKLEGQELSQTVGGGAVSPNQHLVVTDAIAGLPTAGKNPGDSFSLAIEVTYEIDLGGEPVVRKSSGKVTGPLE